jgi:hypothetical protein
MSTQRVTGNDIVAGVMASTMNNSSSNQNDATDLTSASTMTSTAGTTTMSSITDPGFQVLEVSTNPSNKPKWDEHNSYVVNSAKLEDVTLMEMEDGQYKQQPCGRRGSELTAIDGFTINGILINIKNIKVEPLKIFCFRNDIFKPNTRQMLWRNVRKVDLCEAIVHKITKLAANEDPYPNLFADEEPWKGKGKETQSQKRKASSSEIDTLKELEAETRMMIAKAKYEKVNLAKEQANLAKAMVNQAQQTAAHEHYISAIKQRRECFNEAVKSRFDGDRKEAKDCYNRFKQMKRTNGGKTPPTPSSNDTHWSMCCDLNEYDKEIVYSKKQLDKLQKRDDNDNGI